jgi:hypothetical protein
MTDLFTQSIIQLKLTASQDALIKFITPSSQRCSADILYQDYFRRRAFTVMNTHSDIHYYERFRTVSNTSDKEGNRGEVRLFKHRSLSYIKCFACLCVICQSWDKISSAINDGCTQKYQRFFFGDGAHSPPPPHPQYADYSQLEGRNSREGDSSGDVVIEQLTLEYYGGTIWKTRAVASVTSLTPGRVTFVEYEPC